MERVLQRSVWDRLGALLIALLMWLGFTLLFHAAGMVEKAIMVLLASAALVNLIFVLSTPIAKIRGNLLFLYAEAQPVVFDLRPRQVDLSRIIELVIDRKSLYPRAIFMLPHGSEILHAFPIRSERRIRAFLRFIGDVAEPKIID